MTTRPFLFFSILLTSCNYATTNADNGKTTSIEQKDSTPSMQVTSEKNDTTRILQYHLQDTCEIQGNFVLFLRPDSIRFENYSNEDENIYEADSDFGFSISATMHSITRNKRYNNIHTGLSDKRYVLIKDCKNCPQIVDRDTINYGLLLTSKGKEIRVQTNLHSGDYLQDVDEYFNLNGRKDVDRKN